MARESKFGVLLTGSSKGATKAINTTKEGVESLGKTTKKVSASVKKHGDSMADGFARGALTATKWGGAAAAAAVTATAALVKAGLATGDALAKTSDQLGIATEQLAAFNHLATLSGLAPEKLTTGLTKMQKSLGDAERGLSTATDNLSALGLSVEDIIDLAPAEQFDIITGAIGRVENPTQRMSIAMNLFGRGGKDIISIAKGMSGGMEEIAAKTVIAGTALSRVDASKIEHANDAMADVKLLVTGLSQQLAVKFAPLLSVISEKLFGVAKEAGGMGNVATKAFGAMVKAAGTIGDSIKFIQAGWVSIKIGLQEMAIATLDTLEKWGRRATEIYNKIPFLDDRQFSLDLEGFRLTLEDELQASRDSLDTIMNKPWPSEAVETFMIDVERRSDEMAEAVVIDLNTIQGEIIETSDVTKTFAKKTEKATEKMSQSWTEFRGLLSNFFFEIASDGADAWDTLLNGFKGMLTKMAAELVTSEIFGWLGSAANGAGFTGIGSNLIGLANSGSGGTGSGFSFGAGNYGVLGSVYGGVTGAYAAGSQYGSGAIVAGFSEGAGLTAASTSGVPGLNFAVAGDGGAALGGGSSGGASWSAAGWAALVVGVIRTIEDLQGGMYDLSDVLTGESVLNKYSGEIDERTPEIFGMRMGELGVKIGESVRRIANETSFGLFDDIFGSGGPSNAAAQGTLALADGGRYVAGVGNSFSSKNVEGVEAIFDSLTAFSDLIGGSSAKLKVWLGRADGFRLFDTNEDGTRGDKIIETKNNKDFFNAAIDMILKEANNIPDRLRNELIDFEGSLEEIFEFTQIKLFIHELATAAGEAIPELETLINAYEGTLEGQSAYAMSLLEVGAMLQTNPITAAISEFSRVIPTASEVMSSAVQGSFDTLTEIANQFDGTEEAAGKLSGAMAASKQILFEYATSILQLNESISAAATNQAEGIRNSVLTEDQLRAKQIARRDELFAGLSELIDPQQIANTSAELLELNSQIFNSLADEERVASVETFANFAEEIDAISTSILDKALTDLETNAEEANTRINDILVAAAQQNEDAANIQLDAANTLSDAVNTLVSQLSGTLGEIV